MVPVIYLAGGAFAAGLAAGAGATWYVRGVEVGHEENRVAACQVAGEQLRGEIAARDNVIAEQRRSGRLLLDSVGRQTAAIDALAKAGEQRQDAAATALAQVRQYLGPTRLAIDALAARLGRPGDCAQALDEWRGEIGGR